MDITNSDIKLLLKKTINKFYSTECNVIFNILLHNHVLSEQEYCKRLGILSREFNKLIAPLKKDRLIKNESKIENIDGRQQIKQIFYIDPFECYNIIRYKIKVIGKKLNQKTNQTSKEQTYKCESCSIEYTEVEALSMMRDFVFVCKCSAELIETEVNEQSHELYKKMIDCCEDILNLLKKIDSDKIQKVDYFVAYSNKKKYKIDDEKEVILENAESSSKEEKMAETFYFEEKEPKILEEEKVEKKEEKDVYIFVNKVKKLLSEIKEEDTEEMTESEYNIYFELQNED